MFVTSFIITLLSRVLFLLQSHQLMSLLSSLKAGTNKSRILELTIWLVNIDADYNSMNKIYDDWITPGLPPTRACVQAKLASPKYKIEIRVVAATL